MTMTSNKKRLALATFGLAAIISGLMRFLLEEGGQKGLVFGLVMGGAGLIASLLLARGLARGGFVLGGLSMALVAGWFCWESFVIKGWAQAEARQLIMIVVTVIAAFIVFRPEPGGP